MKKLTDDSREILIDQSEEFLLNTFDLATWCDGCDAYHISSKHTLEDVCERIGANPASITKSKSRPVGPLFGKIMKERLKNKGDKMPFSEMPEEIKRIFTDKERRETLEEAFFINVGDGIIGLMGKGGSTQSFEDFMRERVFGNDLNPLFPNYVDEDNHNYNESLRNVNFDLNDEDKITLHTDLRKHVAKILDNPSPDDLFLVLLFAGVVNNRNKKIEEVISLTKEKNKDIWTTDMEILVATMYEKVQSWGDMIKSL